MTKFSLIQQVRPYSGERKREKVAKQGKEEERRKGFQGHLSQEGKQKGREPGVGGYIQNRRTKRKERILTRDEGP